MRRALKILTLVATLGVVWSPLLARAEGYVSPWAGVNFGNDQAEGRANFGASAGYMGAGVIGGEIDFGYSPNFFGEAVDNYAMTAMGNLIIGIPIGGTHGAGVRPYTTGGVGLIRTNLSGTLLNDTSTNDFGFNLGAGLMGYFSDHVGVRGDVRYLRTFKELDLDEFDFGGNFKFWRASIGVVIR